MVDKLDIILRRLAQIESKIDTLADQTPPKYLSVKQAAAYLGTTEVNIHTQLSRRQMPFYKNCNRTFIKVSDIEKLMTRYQSKDELLADYQ